MKLYYSPGSYSLAICIVLRKTNMPHELAKVDLRQHKTASGGDYFQISPKGTAPAPELGGGLLTESTAISQYLTDRYTPTSVPVSGTLERSRLHEILNYLSSDYHRFFTPLFYLSPSDDPAAAQRPVLVKVAYLNNLFTDGRPCILGDEFTVADAYLFVLTRWCPQFGILLASFLALMDFMARIAARPAIRAVLRVEGLEEHPGQR